MNTTQAINPVSLAKQHLMGELGRYIPRNQKQVLASNLRGEEREWFAAKIIELAEIVASMPVSYATDGQGKNAIVHLHYFGGSADWFITEKDVDGGTPQAFGMADLFGDGGELGYISIDELVNTNIELDLHWTAKPLKDAR